LTRDFEKFILATDEHGFLKLFCDGRLEQLAFEFQQFETMSYGKNEKLQVPTEGQLNKLARKANKFFKELRKSRSLWMDEGERVALTDA